MKIKYVTSDKQSIKVINSLNSKNISTNICYINSINDILQDLWKHDLIKEASKRVTSFWKEHITNGIASTNMKLFKDITNLINNEFKTPENNCMLMFLFELICLNL